MHLNTKIEDTNQLNISTKSNEIETVIKSLPTKKIQDMMDSLLNSTRPSKTNTNTLQTFP
jgi:hypothetical protein